MAPAAPVSYGSGCNTGASRAQLPSPMGCVRAILVLLTVSVAPAAMLEAQDAPQPSEPRRLGNRGASFVKFLGGAAVGLATHEAGHVALGAALDADPGLKGVQFGPLPFFAITHSDGRSPRQEFAISSAGFWVQHATSEWLLTRRPRLRSERAPLLKGVLAWNLLASGVYSVAAFGRFGPPERDTRGMAMSLGIAEPWVGAIVLAPAVLDAWRYARPDAAWPRWAARAVKVGVVVLIVAADGR
jgi:hypothetical protein